MSHIRLVWRYGPLQGLVEFRNFDRVDPCSIVGART